MDVIDDPDGGAFARDRLEHSSGGPKDFRKAELLAREPDGRGDSIRDLSLPDQASKLRDALFGRVLRSDPRGATRRFDQGPERDALAVGQAAAAEDQRGRIARVDELADQPALAAARVGDDRRHPSPSLVEGAQQDLAQGGHLRLTPDHGRVLAPPEALDRLRDREQAIRRDVLGLALEHERIDGLDVDRIAHQAMGELADQHLLGRCRLLQASGDVDRVARHQPLAKAGVPGDHLSGVHADLALDRHSGARLELGVELRHGGLHLDGCSRCAQGVVLMEDRQPKNGHHRIANELLDRAAVFLEDGAHALEVAGHRVAESIGRRRGIRVDQGSRVGEHDGDRLAPLLHAGCLVGPRRLSTLCLAQGALRRVVHRDQAIGGHLLLAPSRREGSRLRADLLANQLVGRRRHQDLVRRRVLLHGGGEVAGRTGEHGRSLAGPADDHLTGGDAGAHDQPDAIRLVELVVQVGQQAEALCGGRHGPQGIVVVPGRKPKDRHDRVTDDLLDRAAMRFEGQPHLVEVAGLHLAEGLRIEPLTDARGALPVGGDDRDDASRLLGPGGCRHARRRHTAECTRRAHGNGPQVPGDGPSMIAR